jgi:hypothetical protein
MGLVAKAFQDIITFSRASSGTYVNSNGYITNSSVLNYLTYSNQPENAAWTKSNSFVQQNLLLRSEQFDGGAWTKSNSSVTPNTTIAPNGTLTADELFDSVANTNHFIGQTSTLSAGVHTVSVYAKANVRRRLMLREDSFLGGAGIFDLISGTVISSIGAATASIASVGNGWYRCSVVNPTLPGGATQFSVYVMPDAATVVADSVYIGTGTGLYIWGSQLVQGSVPGDYVATTLAALPCLYADYNGALRARKLCEDATASTSHRILPGTALTIDAAGTYTYSWYVKAGELTEARLTDNNVLGATFNLTTGASSSVSSGYIASSVSLGNGWWRLIISGAAATASGRILIYLSKAGSTTYTGNGSSGIYIADAQLNDGSSALAYYDTTASAYNAPRFDYDPVTLAAKGLLVEEQRANLLTYSNDWSNAVWNKGTNITLTAAATLGPDGNVSATKLQATASAGTIVTQSFTSTATSHTYSVYAKQGSGATDANTFAINNNTTATLLALLTINYSTGVVTQTIGTGATATSAGNGYWRIQIPVTSGITIGNILQVYTGFTGNVETAGEFLYAFGAQAEAGAFATSYIPTVASQVTRAAELASVDTLSPWYNSVAGTLYAEFDAYGGTSINRFYEFASDSNNTIIGFLGASIVYMEWVTASAVSQAQLNAAGSPTQINKVGAAYKANDFAASLNGATPVTDAAGTVPVVNALYLGNARTTGGQLNGHLRRITYYPRRMTNAELQTLTTL